MRTPGSLLRRVRERPRTVGRVLAKLDVRDRVQAVVLAYETMPGWLRSVDPVKEPEKWRHLRRDWP